MKYLVFVLCVLCLSATPVAAETVPDHLQAISVTIKSGTGQGSGTLVTRQVGDETVTFVWTAAHVVDNLRTVRRVITADGNTRILIEFKDAEIVQEFVENGRRVGEIKLDAKVIKYSDVHYGEDLALLMVRRRNAYPMTVSARFITDPDYIPPIGVELSHCGSLLGQFGANSYTTGVLSQVGRTLPMRGANVRVFDQVTAVAFPGSSGGGIYLKETGEYVGMLTQGISNSQGFNFVVPVRRVTAWARESSIEWALDSTVPMPSMEEIAAIPVEDAGAVVGTGGGFRHVFEDTPQSLLPWVSILRLLTF